MNLISGSRSTPRLFYYHLVKFRRDAVERVHVNGGGFLGSAKYFWDTRGQPDIVINGDEGHYGLSRFLTKLIRGRVEPKGYGVSDGHVYKATSEESCVQWDKDHRLLGTSSDLLPGAYNVCGGSNVLLRNWEVPAWLDNKPSIDPRMSLFWDDTHYIIIAIDGRSNGTPGLTLKELGLFGESLGMKYGQNLDGGDSVQLLVDGRIINNLPDGTAHSVVNHIGFWVSGDDLEPTQELPIDGENMFRVIEPVRERTAPNFYAAGIGDNLPAGHTFESQESVLDTRPAGPVAVTWEQDATSDLWIPRNHHAYAIQYLEEIGEPEPPNPNPPDNEEIITVTANSIVPIHEEPMEAAQVVGQVEQGQEVSVYGHVIPDIDRQIYGEKWSRLADKSGYVQAAEFTRPPERKVTAILYVHKDGSVDLTQF